MRLCLYARVSTAEQASEGVSLAAQESRLRAYCTAMGHETFSFIFADAGISGSVPPMEREGFAKARETVRQKKADGIAFVALDRLSRSVRDLLVVADDSRKNGWALVSLRESLDTSSAAGRFVLTILGAVAELERGLISERTSAALSELRRTGRAFTRHAPWGFKIVDGALVANEDERGIATSIEERKYLTAAQLAGTFNNCTGKHPRSGKPWTSRDVDRVRRSIARARKAEGK